MNDISEPRDLIPVDPSVLDLSTIDPEPAIRVAERIVQLVAKKCVGPKFIAPIQGKNYPKVEWWSTVGASLGLFPREESSVKQPREGETVYEATVGVYRGEHLVARASAICSSKEKRWGHADEYAIKSMATTRATGKAYRIGLAFLAVMAGLEPTSAEEIPPGGFGDSKQQHDPIWDDPGEPAPDPAEVQAVSKVKQSLHEELIEFSPKQRDALVRKYSAIVENGQPTKFVESLEKMLSPAISDKWAAATLGKIRQARQSAAAKGGE